MIQKVYNRTNEHRLNDLSINSLGYYTDSGAYYYHVGDGRNYEETMLDVRRNIFMVAHNRYWAYDIEGKVDQ